ncbi:MAG: hypothetical protein LBL01_02750, partial [Bifidobacteriaceae bacterium]|nr:hypothetical protein [Bifidobacteriaceae bacterium]
AGSPDSPGGAGAAGRSGAALAAKRSGAAGGAGTAGAAGGAGSAAKLRREAAKSLAACERRLEKLRAQEASLAAQAQTADPADWEAQQRLGSQLREVADGIGQEEQRWLDLAEAAGL